MEFNIDVSFVNYISNTSYYETLVFGDSNSVLNNSQFNPKLPVIFLIHGFLTSFKDHFIQRVKNGELSKFFSTYILKIFI